MDKHIPLVFGKALRRLRLAAGFTQEELGFRAGLQRNYISSLELGEKQPSLVTIFKLSTALNIKPGRLLDHMENVAEGTL